MDIVIYSWHQSDEYGEYGGFLWRTDSPAAREELTRMAAEDGEPNRVVVALTVRPEATTSAEDITEWLDADLFFESGRVGRVLFRSRTFTSEH